MSEQAHDLDYCLAVLTRMEPKMNVALAKTHDFATETHRVLLTVHHHMAEQYTLTITDADSGSIIGRIFRSANPNGCPPRFVVADVLERVAGLYRSGQIEIRLSRVGRV